ncbi:alpha/beta fold hydrolase, partial [Micromonospora sp. NPDC003197]
TGEPPFGAAGREAGNPAGDRRNPRPLGQGDVNQDMDAIRAALGERKLNYYGVSYGTLIGQQYAQRYPNRIRTMVLDSNMDHSITTAWRFMRTEATGVEESFDEFVAWCQRSTECALHGQDVRKIFRELRAKVEQGEVSYPGTDITLTPLVFLRVVMRMLYGPEWNELAQLLVVLRAGGPVPADLATSAPELLPTTGSAGTVTLPASPTGTTEVAVRDATLIICQDWRLPVRSAAELAIYRQALTLVAPDMTLSPLGWLVPVACAGLDNLHRNPQAPLRFTGSPSILMLTSRYDPSTPYEWTMTAAQQSGVRVLQYDGWGHGVYFKGSACSIAATDNYLITTRLPAAGAHCPAVEPTDGALRRGPVAPPTIRMWS